VRRPCDESRQALRAAVARDEPSAISGWPSLALSGGQPQRARHRQLAAACRARSVDGRNHRLPHVFDQVEDMLAGERVLASAGRRGGLEREAH